MRTATSGAASVWGWRGGAQKQLLPQQWLTMLPQLAWQELAPLYALAVATGAALAYYFSFRKFIGVAFYFPGFV